MAGSNAVDADTVWQCPICLVKVVGEEERDKHAKGEPGLKPSGMVRV